MPTERSSEHVGFGTVEGRPPTASFDGGAITSDAGALLPDAAGRAVRPVERIAACFADGRRQKSIEHEVATLVGQRVVGIALGEA